MENYITVLLPVAFIVILIGVLNSLRIFTIISVLSKQYQLLKQSVINQEDYPPLIIFIAVLKESRIIAKTLESFNQLSYPRDKLKIVIVSTEREYETNPSPHKNTILIVKNKVIELNQNQEEQKFVHIHYPFLKGIKSDQLNYALAEIQKTFPKLINNKTYIGLYDADSNVPTDTLVLLAKDAIREKYPEVYQQPTFYFKNYAFLPHTVNGVLSGAFSFLQTAYALYYETYILGTYPSAPITPKLPRMKYCIGHGLFIKWDLLEKLGLFPTPIEDTRLGHILSYLKKEIRILPVFDAVETTSGILAQIKQTSVWFIGEAFFIKDLKIAQGFMKMKLSKLHNIWLIIYKIYRNVFWIVRGPLLLFLFIFSLYSQIVILGFAILIAYLYLPAIGLILSRHRLSQLIAAPIPFSKKNALFTFWALLALLLEIVIMSIGALLGLMYFIRFSYAKESLPFFKTDR